MNDHRLLLKRELFHHGIFRKIRIQRPTWYPQIAIHLILVETWHSGLTIDIFIISLHRYDERIDRVETRITARLRDQLGLAKNANEMFRIFSRFNALFVRPHIRGAIREYQTQLMQRVKDDIEVLHDKFKV